MIIKAILPGGADIDAVAMVLGFEAAGVVTAVGDGRDAGAGIAGTRVRSRPTPSRTFRSGDVHQVTPCGQRDRSSPLDAGPAVHVSELAPVDVRVEARVPSSSYSMAWTPAACVLASR